MLRFPLWNLFPNYIVAHSFIGSYFLSFTITLPLAEVQGLIHRVFLPFFVCFSFAFLGNLLNLFNYRQHEQHWTQSFSWSNYHLVDCQLLIQILL